MSTTFPSAKARVFATDYEAPEVIQAASLAMGLLKKTKQQSMAELSHAVAAKRSDVLDSLSKIRLTPRQLDLLGTYATELSLVRCQPHAHLVFCSDCRACTLTGSTAPARCQVTDGCRSKDQHRSAFPNYLPADADIPAIEDEPLSDGSDPDSEDGTHCTDEDDTW